MADISLLFDVAMGGGNPSGDTEATIRGQLETIVANINQKPFSIQFQADEESLKKFQKQVSEITSKLEMGTGVSLGGFAQTARQIDITASALHTMNSVVSESNLDKIALALSDTSGVSISAGAISDIITRLEDLSVTLTEAKVQFEDLGKTGERVPKLLIKGFDAQGNTINRSLRFDNKGKLKKDLTEIGIKLANVRKASKGVGNSVKSSGQQASEGFVAAKKAVTDYYNALIKRERDGLTNVITQDDKDRWVTSNPDYEARTAQLNRLQKAYNDATNSKAKFTASEQKKITTHETEQIEKYNVAVENVNNTENKRSQSLKNAESLLRSYDETISRCKKNLKDWSAAEHSKHASSRDSYADFKDHVMEAENARESYNNVTISLEEYTKRMNELKTSNISTKETLKDNGDAAKTLGERLVNLAKKFTQWFSASQMVMFLYRSAKKMIDAVKELDAAMTELKKVTNETDETYNQFLNHAATRAKKIGVSLTDVVNTTADFARLGLSIEDAEAVSDAALIYKNVGDGIESIDVASEHIISTMQAYKDEISSAINIVDKFNNVGNNFAISSGGIGEAMLRSASSMHAANNTIDETIALITAANTVIQDPDKVGKVMPNNTVMYCK